MRKLFAYILLAIMFLSALTAATYIVSHQQPDPQIVQQLHLSDCALPCWMGITPGQADDYDEIAHFRDQLLKIKAGSKDEQMIKLGGTTLIDLPLDLPGVDIATIPIAFSLTRDSIRQIRIPALLDRYSVDYPMPRLGDLLWRLGSPTCVKTANRLYFDLIYVMKEGTVEIRMPVEQSVDLTRPVDALTVYNYTSMGDPCWSSVNWHGVARREHYQPQP